MKTDWYYKTNKAITDVTQLPNSEELEGFVYKITNVITGKFYIGKKSLWSVRKKKISLRAKKTTGTRKTFERVTKESDWKNYYGSSKDLKDDVNRLGKTAFKREILELCKSKKYLSYAEFAWQVKLDVLRTDSYNGNILGRWFNKDMEL
jgi:hypothetical protein